ncbi:MAG TPA: hypothetical protein VF619_03195 [Allosphingosinicella sp.]|jgi:hypothetical protein
MKARILFAGCVALAAAAAASAAPKRTLPPAVQELAACRTLAADDARLRCYDAAAAALARAAESGDIVLVDREDVRKTRRSLFGFNVPKLPFFSGDDSAADQQDEITARIAGAHSIGNGKWIIRLEDGAVWETTEGKAAVRAPRAGNEVTIKRGSLGGYFLRIAGQRTLRARRVS